MAIVFTVGHSNRKWGDFISILKDNHVDLVVDVRRYPASRACPQFNKEQMTIELRKENVSYIHIEKLGGRLNKLDTKEVDAVVMRLTMLDGKTRALELMLIIWQPHPLAKVSMNYFCL
jgi:uncharacterized protein (DUF488 family)